MRANAERNQNHDEVGAWADQHPGELAVIRQMLTAAGPLCRGNPDIRREIGVMVAAVDALRAGELPTEHHSLAVSDPPGGRTRFAVEVGEDGVAVTRYGSTPPDTLAGAAPARETLNLSPWHDSPRCDLFALAADWTAAAKATGASFSLEVDGERFGVLPEESAGDTPGEVVLKRLLRSIIRDLMGMDHTLSGEDSGLATTWGELCVQQQGELSVDWDCYDQTIRAMVDGGVNNLPREDLRALWEITDTYDADDDQGVMVEDVCEMVYYGLLRCASDYRNRPIAAFLARGFDEDADDEAEDDFEEEEEEEDLEGDAEGTDDDPDRDPGTHNDNPRSR